METILQDFQGTYIENDKSSNYIISRRNPLDTALKAIQKKTADDLKCKMFVKFTGEIGQDHGGPRREFFRYNFKNLKTSCKSYH